MWSSHMDQRAVIKVFFISFLLLSPFALYSMIWHMGYNSFDTCSISIAKYVLTGTVKGNVAVNVDVNTIQGDGLILSKKITIVCDEFNFTGTIECNGECSIYCKNPFDYDAFKRKGRGRFVIIISPYRHEPFTESTLMSKACSLLVCDPLHLTKEQVDMHIKHLRRNAAVNNIDEKSIFEKIQEEVNAYITYYKKRLDEKWDCPSLYKGMLSGGLAMGGFAGCYAGYKDVFAKLLEYIGVDKSAFLIALGLVSTIPLVIACHFLANGLSPCHAEKYEKLCMVRERIDKAMTKPRVCQEQVIRLQ